MTLSADIVQRIALKALIIHEGKILVLREAATYDEGTNGGRYQLPGGRVEPGENIFDALKREVQEETGLQIEVGQPIYAGEWSPVIKGVQHQIVGMFFVCNASENNVRLSHEHDSYKWIDPTDSPELHVISPDDKAIQSYALL